MNTEVQDRAAKGAAVASTGVETHGRSIVILERGFIFVGDAESDDKWIRIAGARSIIRWGTKNHLAQLAKDGPQANTRLGDPSDVKAPLGSLIAILPVDAAKWNG